MSSTDLPSLRTLRIGEKVSIKPNTNPAVNYCPFDFAVFLIMKSSLLAVISYADLLRLNTLEIARSSLRYCSTIELKSGYLSFW